MIPDAVILTPFGSSVSPVTRTVATMLAFCGSRQLTRKSAFCTVAVPWSVMVTDLTVSAEMRVAQFAASPRKAIEYGPGANGDTTRVLLSPMASVDVSVRPRITTRNPSGSAASGVATSVIVRMFNPGFADVLLPATFDTPDRPPSWVRART